MTSALHHVTSMREHKLLLEKVFIISACIPHNSIAPIFFAHFLFFCFFCRQRISLLRRLLEKKQQQAARPETKNVESNSVESLPVNLITLDDDKSVTSGAAAGASARRGSDASSGFEDGSSSQLSRSVVDDMESSECLTVTKQQFFSIILHYTTQPQLQNY